MLYFFERIKLCVLITVLCASTLFMTGCPKSAITVPPLIGLTSSSAATLLTSHNLILGETTQAYSDSVVEGTIISQDPPASEVVLPETSISVVLSLGPEPVNVPTITGLRLTSATAALDSVGFYLGEISEAYSDTVVAGQIISQDPVADTALQPGATISVQVSLGPSPVIVPSLIGLSQSEASTALQLVALSLGDISQTYSDTVETGIIVAQNPQANAEVLPGATVNVTLSVGPAPIIVPDLTGFSEDDAENALLAIGLTLGTVTDALNETTPTGKVVSQIPAADTYVSPGTAVALVISREPVTVTVPNVVQMSKDDAESSLITAGLQSGIIIEVYSDTIPEDQVIAQYPEQNAELTFGASVTLVVSLGIEPVAVPDVIGLTRTEARSALEQAGLVLGEISYVESETEVAGFVFAQEPAPDTEVPPGSSISITLNYSPNFASTDYEVTRTWDATTTGFNQPNGVAVDPDGNVYITDMNNHRVVVLDADGEFLRSWGTNGSEDGQFNRPFSNAVSIDNKVYVADTDNQRVQVFTNEGQHLATWDGYQIGSDPYVFFSRVFGLTVGNNGRVYILDTDRGKVVVMDESGNPIDVWDPADSSIGSFNEPFGTAVDENTGNLFVSDSYNARAVEFNADGAVVATWEGDGTEAGPMGTVHDVVVDPTGNLFIVDTGSNKNRVLKVSPDGELLAIIGSDILAHPTGVDIDYQGNLYVVDLGSNRVLKYAPVVPSE